MIDDFWDDSNDGSSSENILQADINSPEILNDNPFDLQKDSFVANAPNNISQISNAHLELSWGDEFSKTVFDNFSNEYVLEIHGDPISEIDNFDFQDAQNSCAIATTNMLFNSFGYDFGEDIFSDVFETLDIYSPEAGTSPNFIDEAINIFSEVNGLDLNATEINNFNIEELQAHLDSGNKLLIALDSYELHHDDVTLNEVLCIPDSGHAVQLTGIIKSDEGDFAVINDPGYPEGAGVEIPIDRFMDACSDFDYTAISVNKVIG